MFSRKACPERRRRERKGNSSSPATREEGAPTPDVSRGGRQRLNGLNVLNFSMLRLCAESQIGGGDASRAAVIDLGTTTFNNVTT